MREKLVSVVKDNSVVYPHGNFDPPFKYPEFTNIKYLKELDKGNKVYSLVRESFIKLELDKENIGTKYWNPLTELVKKGDKVIIKPNLVFSKHVLGAKGVQSMITHASVIRPIIDYVLLATEGDVDIKICDVPLQSAIWKDLIKKGGYRELVEFYKSHKIDIELIDLRREIALKNNEGIIYKKIRIDGDPLGYKAVDLGKKSYIQDIIEDYKKLEITDYSRGTVSKHHNPNKNEYLLPKTILNADVFINVPKLKTHKKAGITVSMKNLVGINGDKSWIAHHRKGVDEYPEFHFPSYFKWYFSYYLKMLFPNFVKNLVYKWYRIIFLKGKSMSVNVMEGKGTLLEGNWYGNDTIWRTIIDLNNILFFSDKKGKMQNSFQKKYLSIVDGIVGMEKEGPMHGIPKNSGVIIAGYHPVAVDYLCSYIMGLDYTKIPQIKEAFDEKYFGLTNFSPDDIKIRSDIDIEDINLGYIPSKGWSGHLER